MIEGERTTYRGGYGKKEKKRKRSRRTAKSGLARRSSQAKFVRT
jgi:hypothetical protein